MPPTVPPSAPWSGQRIWITGGRGFIGSRLATLAASDGATVGLFSGDVRDEAAVRTELVAFQPDLVLHLAARVDVRRDPSLAESMHDVIVGGARHVRAAAHACPGPVQVVQVGTCEEYGTIEAPFAEDHTPSAPVSPYAAAKLFATREALADTGPARIVVARPFLTYGPGQRSRQLIPALIDAALNSRPFPMTQGLQTREVNYVDDIVLGLLRAATTQEAAGRIVNIGGGEELAVVDLARRVFALVGADASLLQPGALPTRIGEVPRFCSDPSLCRTLLGHEPQVSLEQGLSRTITYARLQAGEQGGEG